MVPCRKEAGLQDRPKGLFGRHLLAKFWYYLVAPALCLSQDRATQVSSRLFTEGSLINVQLQTGIQHTDIRLISSLGFV